MSVWAALRAAARGRGRAPVGDDPLIALYGSLVAAGDAFILGHLGQSLDGRIALENGDSYYVNGPEGLDHLHHLRAVFDVVMVGAGTVARDDPQLTVRRCVGQSPVRVIIDPRRRLPPDRRVFAPGGPHTIILCAEGVDPGDADAAEVLPIPMTDGGLDLSAARDALKARGLGRLFIEGGGCTVSAFLAAGLLDRLQVSVAPFVIGSGPIGLALPALDRLRDAKRPPARRFILGEDTLFDLDLRAAP